MSMQGQNPRERSLAQNGAHAEAPVETQEKGPVNGELKAAAELSAEIRPPRVEIYVADHCMICEYAHEVAERIRTDFPRVELTVVNVSHPVADVPEQVFATPTYLLNGRLWSLGNPSPEDVQRRLAQALGEYVLATHTGAYPHHDEQ